MDGQGSTGIRGIARALFSREFWSFRAINALFGALLTIGAGVAQFAIGDSYRDEVVQLSEQSREIDEQLKRIDNAVFEFKLFESDGVLVQVLSAGGIVPEALQTQMRAISIINRRHAFLAILAEVETDPTAFASRLSEYDEQQQGAIAWNKELADALLANERDTIIAAHGLQQDLIRRQIVLTRDIDERQANLASYQATSFSIQQAGILLVLLGNMLADFFGAGRSRPAPPGPAKPEDEEEAVEAEASGVSAPR